MAAKGKSFEELKQELSGGSGVTTVDEVRKIEICADVIKSITVAT